MNYIRTTTSAGTKNTHVIFYTTMRIRSLISAYQSTMTLSQTTIDKP